MWLIRKRNTINLILNRSHVPSDKKKGEHSKYWIKSTVFGQIKEKLTGVYTNHEEKLCKSFNTMSEKM